MDFDNNKKHNNFVVNSYKQSGGINNGQINTIDRNNDQSIFTCALSFIKKCYTFLRVIK
jgi:hypothetical protein